MIAYKSVAFYAKKVNTNDPDFLSVVKYSAMLLVLADMTAYPISCALPTLH